MDRVEHPRRPARLVRGELEPWPEARASNCAVWIPVPDGDDGAAGAEAVPAVRLDGDRARLSGIPFFPYHVGLDDEVCVREHDGALYLVDVVAASAFLVVRLFDAERGIDLEQALTDPTADEPFWRIARALALHGAWFERMASSYAAFAIPRGEWEYVQPFLDLKGRVDGLQWELATPMRTLDAAP